MKDFSFLPTSSSQRHHNKQGRRRRRPILEVVCALSTNALQVHHVYAAAAATTKQSSSSPLDNTVVVVECVATLDRYGHPTGIRSIALSSDDTQCCTVSKNVIKFWNTNKRSCIHSNTLSSLRNNNNNDNNNNKSSSSSCYGLCVAYLPGNSHVVMGTREGHLILLDVASGGDVVYVQHKAHDEAIWSLDVRRPSSSLNSNSDIAIAVVTGSGLEGLEICSCQRREQHGS